MDQEAGVEAVTDELVADQLEVYIKACHCGHDRASHYWDHEGKSGNCLARGCECKAYVNEHDPKPVVPKTRSMVDQFKWGI